VTNTDNIADEPYAPPASGGDYDSVRRGLKHQLAAATTAGGADDLQGQIDKLDTDRAKAEKKTAAAAARREAAEVQAETGGDAKTKPPVGRAPAAKATTARVDKE